MQHHNPSVVQLSIEMPSRLVKSARVNPIPEMSPLVVTSLVLEARLSLRTVKTACHQMDLRPDSEEVGLQNIGSLVR